MPDRFITRLEHATRLTAADKARLQALDDGAFDVGAHEDITSEGQHTPCGHVVVEGLAVTYKLLADGSRQIFHFMLPGDTCDLHRQNLDWRDHSVAALVPTRVVRITPDEVDAMARDYPNIAQALWWAMLNDQAVLRERLVSLGRRSAERRIAHLFCELLVRSRAVGLTVEENGTVAYPFPVTQPELADAVGLTAVHVNRTLQQLRELVSFRQRRVVVQDPARLASLAGFDHRYLHLGPIEDQPSPKSRAVMRST